MQTTYDTKSKEEPQISQTLEHTGLGESTTINSGAGAGLPLFMLFGGVQTKLSVNQPGDSYEVEADRVAQAAVHGESAPHRIKNSPNVTAQLQRSINPSSCSSCGLCMAGRPCPDKHSLIQRKPSSGDQGTFPGASTLPLPDSGSSLAPNVKARAENVLGIGLDHVRVHNSGEAQSAAEGLHARAFTHQNHIWLGPGESPDDVGLMAHEAAHVLQQSQKGSMSVIQRQDQKASAQRTPIAWMIADDFDPCSVREEALTNTMLLAYWTRSDAYLKAREKGEDRYYDYANLMRRLVKERRSRVKMGHAWLAVEGLTGVPDRLYEIVPGVGLMAIIVIGNPAEESGMPRNRTSAVVTPSQFDEFLRKNGIPQMSVEGWYGRQSLQNPEALTLTLPPPPPTQAPFILGFDNPYQNPFDPYGSMFPGQRWNTAMPIGLGASGLTASPFDVFGRGQFLQPVYTPGTSMTNPRSVTGAELNWRGDLPEINMMRGTYADMLRYRDLNRVQSNFPVFDITTRSGPNKLISVTHSLPGPGGQVGMEHYAEKVRIMSGDYDPKGTNKMGQAITGLNQEFGTSLTVTDINQRNYLAVPNDHVQMVQDAIEARITSQPNAYMNLVDGLLRAEPITIGNVTYQSWNQVQSARSSGSLNDTDFQSLRQQVGQKARARIIGIGMTTPELITIQNIRTSMQLRNFSPGQTSVIATPEVLQTRRLMANGMTEGQALSIVAKESGVRGAGMSMVVAGLGGAYDIATGDYGDPRLWARTGSGVLLAGGGGYGQAYLETQLTTRMLSPLLTEATSVGGASASSLTGGGLAARGVGGTGAGAVVAPVVTWLGMAADEAFFGADYTRIDYYAKGARAGVSGAAAAGGGALAAGLTGAVAGSEVPILGNAVGFAVGVGIYYLSDWLFGDDIEESVREAMGEYGCQPSAPKPAPQPEYQEPVWKCFVGETPVRMADGTDRRIDELHEGDEVLSFDERDSTLRTERVIKIESHPAPIHLKLRLAQSSTEVGVTGEHPLYSKGLWRLAKTLDVGSVVTCLGDKASEISEAVVVQVIKITEPVTVYDLTVSNCHTFFAGGLLAHNKNF